MSSFLVKKSSNSKRNNKSNFFELFFENAVSFFSEANRCFEINKISYQFTLSSLIIEWGLVWTKLQLKVQKIWTQVHHSFWYKQELLMRIMDGKIIYPKLPRKQVLKETGSSVLGATRRNDIKIVSPYNREIGGSTKITQKPLWYPNVWKMALKIMLASRKEGKTHADFET